MRISTKLSWGSIIVIFLIAVSGYFALSTSQKRLRKSTGNEYATFAAEILDKIDRHVFNRMETFYEYSNNSKLRKQLVELNRKSMKLDDIQAYIEKQDQQWISVPDDQITPFMQELISNELSSELRDKIEYYKSKYFRFNSKYCLCYSSIHNYTRVLHYI